MNDLMTVKKFSPKTGKWRKSKFEYLKIGDKFRMIDPNTGKIRTNTILNKAIPAYITVSDWVVRGEVYRNDDGIQTVDCISAAEYESMKENINE